MIGCPFEQAHGRPCLLCRHAAGGVPVHAADHPDHRAAAEAADRIATQQLYAERGLHLFSVEVVTLPAGDRRALDLWAASADPLPMTYRHRSHVAGAVLAGVPPRQPCTRCHLVLQDHAAFVEDGAYPVGAFVGLDCVGQPSLEVAGA